MNIATAPLSRRTFLCGTGLTLALPMFDAMFSLFARAASNPAPPVP